MKYKSFRIRNFKGIKDTTIELHGLAGANVFALVGLNESGKTTVLEAIHSFAPDHATSELLGGKAGVPFKDRVPRHLISEFTDDVSVIATLLVSSDDKKTIARELLKQHGLAIDERTFPDEVVFESVEHFENGDFTEAISSSALISWLRARGSAILGILLPRNATTSET
jgi:predicted ATP-dependent endonuclease of OLD family